MSTEQAKSDRPIVLFVDESRQSEEAIQLVESTGLRFEIIPASGHNIPAADLGPDSTFFNTLSGVELLVRGLAPEAYEAWRRDRAARLRCDSKR